MPAGYTGIPLGDDHPGAFGYRRANHRHEGVDLYVPEGTEVVAVEPGVVVAVIPFTGQHAQPSSPWWHDTWAVLVEGPTGVVVYGEVTPAVQVDDLLEASQTIGHVKQVLVNDKGRPMSMLHLELHKPGTRDAFEWLDARPESLLDPTSELLRPASYARSRATP